MFHWSISLLWNQYHAVLITVVLQYSLKPGNVMPPDLLFLLRITLAILNRGGVWVTVAGRAVLKELLQHEE